MYEVIYVVIIGMCAAAYSSLVSVLMFLLSASFFISMLLHQRNRYTAGGIALGLQLLGLIVMVAFKLKELGDFDREFPCSPNDKRLDPNHNDKNLNENWVAYKNAVK